MAEAHTTPVIFLNAASGEDLRDLDGVSDAAVDRLLERRPFNDWDEVTRAGVDGDTVKALKDQGVGLVEPGGSPIGEPGSGGSPGDNMGRA